MGRGPATGRHEEGSPGGCPLLRPAMGIVIMCAPTRPLTVTTISSSSGTPRAPRAGGAHRHTSPTSSRVPQPRTDEEKEALRGDGSPTVSVRARPRAEAFLTPGPCRSKTNCKQDSAATLPPCTPASGHAGHHLKAQAVGWPGWKGPSCTRHTRAPRASQSSTSQGYRAASTLPLASS